MKELYKAQCDILGMLRDSEQDIIFTATLDGEDDLLLICQKSNGAHTLIFYEGLNESPAIHYSFIPEPRREDKTYDSVTFDANEDEIGDIVNMILKNLNPTP